VGVTVNTTATDIKVSVSDQAITASVGGGIGPQGPASTAAAGVSTLNGLTGTLTVSAGANVTVTTGTAGLTISGASGGASSWNDITGKPNLVNSVAGRTGTVTLTTADLPDFATAAAKYGPVTSVAGRTGSVTLSSSDVSGLATVATSGKYADLSGTPTLATIATSGSASDLASGTVPTARLSVATTTAVGVVSSSSGLSITAAGALSADVRSVAGRTGAVTLVGSDVPVATTTAVGVVSASSGLSVTSVAGRTGSVTISSGDVSGLASIATSGSASDLSAGTVPTARLPVATTTAVGVISASSGVAVTAAGALSANVRTVAGRTGDVTLASSDISDFATQAAKYGPVTSVAGRTGDVTLVGSDVPVATTTAVGVVSASSGLSVTAGGALSADVRSVAGRTGSVTLSTADISGNLVQSVNGLTGTLTIAAGANVTVSTAASTITIAAAAGSSGMTDTLYRAAERLSATAVDAIPRLATLAANQTLAANRCYWTFFSPTTNITVSQIAAACYGTTAAGMTLCRMGLYTYNESTGALTLVAQTASDTTLFAAASTIYTRSFSTAGGYPASYSLTAGTVYAVAICQLGATQNPGVVGTSVAQSILAALAPPLALMTTGNSDLPTSATPTTNGENKAIWFRLS
jgi:hypothetical protein